MPPDMEYHVIRSTICRVRCIMLNEDADLLRPKMVEIYYVKAAGQTVSDVAAAVGIHLNVLGSGRETIKLHDVTKITIEDVDKCPPPPDILDEFESLRQFDAGAATNFRKSLIHYRIISSVMSDVYEVVKYRIRVIPIIDSDKPKDAKLFDIRDIIKDIGTHTKTVIEFYEGKYHLEKRAKDVFEQVVSPRLDDLSLGVAKAATAKKMKEGFETVREGFETVEVSRDNMEKRLLDAIVNSKKIP
jgi:hypothetical protein